MENRARTQLALGLILLLLAAWFAALKINPALADLIPPFDWPMWVVLAGGIVLVIGLLTGAAEMAIPACLVAGVGGILYYQNASGDWESWSYMWTLIPGFVGVGRILSGILGRGFREALRHGLNLILISLAMFVVFGAIFGGLELLGPYKEYALAIIFFLLGLWFLVRGLLRSRRA